MPVMLFAMFVLLVIVVGYFGYMQAKKRREDLARLAGKLGFRFEPDQDDGRLGGRFDCIDLLQQGSDRYTENHLIGQVDGRAVVVCDYHYETYTTDSKGHRETHHHYFGVVFVEIPLRMSQVCIRHENILDKVAGALGFDDIDFESAEFSRRFYVSGKDRKFAYDLIHARAMEYLMAHDGYSWEFDAGVIALYQSGTYESQEIRPAIETAMGFIALIPEYVWSERGSAAAAGA